MWSLIEVLTFQKLRLYCLAIEFQSSSITSFITFPNSTPTEVCTLSDYTLSLIKKIEAALKSTGEPRPTPIWVPEREPAPNPDTYEVAGELPVPLRHLHNLLYDTSEATKEAYAMYRDTPDESDEEADAYRIAHLLVGEYEVIRTLFFNEVTRLFPANPRKHKGYCILHDWTVCLIKKEDPFTALLNALGGGGVSVAWDETGRP